MYSYHLSTEPKKQLDSQCPIWSLLDNHLHVGHFKYDEMRNMINIIHTVSCYIWRVNPKSSHHKGKKNHVFFSFILYLYEMMDGH